MEKHTPYFNLLEQLAKPGCAVCAEAGRSVERFLDTYLYEGVNDETNWNTLMAAGGWCARHARELAAFSDGLAVSLFYRHLTRTQLAQLGKLEKKPLFQFRKKKHTPCPGCRYERETEQQVVRLYAQALQEDEFMQAVLKSEMPCLRHASQIALRAGKGGEAFVQAMRTRAEELCAELDEFVRKSDYAVKEKMGREGDAWKRVLKFHHGFRL